jgi:hypothetical protein
MMRLLRKLLPDHPVFCRILRGPFRGARVRLNPRVSMRKIFGLYEHEVNEFVNSAMPLVTTLYDIGANDGYFTIGALQCFSRLGVSGQVFAFDPQSVACDQLNAAATPYRSRGQRVEVVQTFVDEPNAIGALSLDAYIKAAPDRPATNALIKIDVEGAEARVLRGASLLLSRSNYFLIELHSGALVDEVSTIFRDFDLPFEILSQRALPLIGRENRSTENWWLVSKI